MIILEKVLRWEKGAQALFFSPVICNLALVKSRADMVCKVCVRKSSSAAAEAEAKLT